MFAAAAVDEDESDHLVVEDQRNPQHRPHIPARHGAVVRAWIVEGVVQHDRTPGSDDFLAEPVTVEARFLAPDVLGDVAGVLAIPGRPR